MLVLHHQGITSADYANQMLKMLTTLSHHVTKCQQGNTYHFVRHHCIYYLENDHQEEPSRKKY